MSKVYQVKWKREDCRDGRDYSEGPDNSRYFNNRDDAVAHIRSLGILTGKSEEDYFAGEWFPNTTIRALDPDFAEESRTVARILEHETN